MLREHTLRLPPSTQLQTQRFSHSFELVISECLNILTSSDEVKKRRRRLHEFLSSVLNPPSKPRGESKNSPFTDEEIRAIAEAFRELPQEVYFKIKKVLEADSSGLNLKGTNLADLIFPYLREGVDGNETLTNFYKLYFPILESVLGAIVGLSYLYALAKFEAESMARTVESTNTQEINPIDFLDKFFGEDAKSLKEVISEEISSKLVNFNF
jgi:type I restriction-modification system DNA methylase subunit